MSHRGLHRRHDSGLSHGHDHHTCRDNDSRNSGYEKQRATRFAGSGTWSERIKLVHAPVELAPLMGGLGRERVIDDVFGDAFTCGLRDILPSHEPSIWQSLDR